MFMKLSYLKGRKRFNDVYSKYPPSKVYVFTGGIACSKNNTKEGFKHGIVPYAWFIWEKGKVGPTYLKWLE